MSFLLDTNVISEVRRPSGNPGVKAWFEATPADLMFLSVLTLGEIRAGADRLLRRDPAQAAIYLTWLARLRQDYADQVLAVTADVAEEWGRLTAAGPLPTVDGLIAATARVHNLTVVTRNKADFEPTGVSVLNPFAS